jgi:hypothetical protein
MNDIDLPTDSADYEVLYNAASSIKDVEGLVCEIGTRRGGSTKYIIDGLLNAEDFNRTFICVDPYGSIEYFSNEHSCSKPDYTNDMRNDAIINIYKYVLSKPINVLFFCLEDTEFFKRFEDGVPVYNDIKKLINQYSLVFFDGPHCSASIIKEVEFFYPRTVIGSKFVFDDVCDYNHSLIHESLIKNNFKQTETSHRKVTYIKQ